MEGWRGVATVLPLRMFCVSACLVLHSRSSSVRNFDVRPPLECVAHRPLSHSPVSLLLFVFNSDKISSFVDVSLYNINKSYLLQPALLFEIQTSVGINSAKLTSISPCLNNAARLTWPETPVTTIILLPS